MSDRAARAMALHHAKQAAICDSIVPWEHGTALRATDLPTFYDFNDIRVEGPDAGLTVEAVVAAADRLLTGLRHRQVEVEDEAAGRRLRPGFEALGWEAERLVWMELSGPARGAPPAPVEISEVPVDRTRCLREDWYTSGPRPDPEAWRRFIALEEIVAARSGSRMLMAWGPAGEALGYVSYSTRGGLAEVEQAFVSAACRGRGIGGALVTAAVDAAGAQTTFIVADDEEAAKRLYLRLGFEPVWIQHQFTRRGPGE